MVIADLAAAARDEAVGVVDSTPVLITRLGADDFLSYEHLDLPLDPGLNVVTGPNGAGKSALCRLLRLTKVAVAAAATNSWAAVERDYAQAGRYGAPIFAVRVGATVQEPGDLTLLEDWARAAVVTALSGAQRDQAARIEKALAQDLRAADILAEGELVVRFDTAMRHPWSVRWRTSLADVDLLSGRVTRRVAAASRTRITLNWLGGQADPVLSSEGHLPTMTLQDLLGPDPTELSARPLGMPTEPSSIRTVHRRLGIPIDMNRGPIGFARVLARLLDRVVISDESGDVDATTVGLEQMTDPRVPLPANAPLGAQLLRRKNGHPALRTSFARAQEAFRELTGAGLDVVEQAIDGGTEGHQLAAIPVVPTVAPSGECVDIPLRLSGQGLVEAARLAVLLTDPVPVLVLDEPAASVSAVLQRRLLSQLLGRSERAQTIVITHSAHLVPARGPDDLRRIVRLSRGPAGATQVHRATGGPGTLDRDSRLLKATDIRNALFAAAVWLVEGATEEEAMTVWLADADKHGLPTPESAHVVVLPVDGHQNFAKHAELLRNLGIPYGILADGPALREGGPLRSLPGAPDLAAVPDQFEDRRSAWAAVGVQTLADNYHDDGSKQGEIEAFFDRVNSTEWALVSGKGKINKGGAFASAVPMPAEVRELWRRFLGDVGLLHT